MKITIIAAGGNIGQRIVQEAAARNHELKLISSKSKDFFGIENAELVATDIFDTKALGEAIKGSDVVISAYAPPHNNVNNVNKLTPATESLIETAKEVNVRLIAVGGAGSLKVSETLQLVDAPNFPEEYKAIAIAHRDVLEGIYDNEKELEWTNVSPSAYIFEGEKTNNFRIAENTLILNEKGESAISMEDFAVGILNEVEIPKFKQKRFTIGY